jgi:hypothetical protein
MPASSVLPGIIQKQGRAPGASSEDLKPTPSSSVLLGAVKSSDLLGAVQEQDQAPSTLSDDLRLAPTSNVPPGAAQKPVVAFKFVESYPQKTSQSIQYAAATSASSRDAPPEAATRQQEKTVQFAGDSSQKLLYPTRHTSPPRLKATSPPQQSHPKPPADEHAPIYPVKYEEKVWNRPSSPEPVKPASQDPARFSDTLLGPRSLPPRPRFQNLDGPKKKR